MKKAFSSLAVLQTFLLLILSNVVFSQLVNNGGTITIQTNALIICTGDVQNISGTLTNNGKLEVQGNFFNSGTYNTTTSDDSLIMNGPGNATLNTGAATLSYLHINKTLATDEVKLASSVLLSTKFIYDQGNFTTDPIINPSFVLSAPASAAFSFAAGKEIIGKVRRTSWVNGSTVVFNQPNMLVTTNTGTVPTDFTVTMIPQSSGGDPTQSEREVKRKFQFSVTGGAGFTADIRYPYSDAELNTNLEGSLVPWQLVTTEWNGRLTPVTRDGVSNYVSTTGITSTELANEWKLADSKYTFNVTAQLRGSSNGTSMTTGLNSGGLLDAFALSQPYINSPFNYAGSESVSAGFFAAHPNIVDWVLVEFRKPISGLPADALSSTITGRKAGFLLSSGIVVDVDGISPIAYNISKQGAGFIVIRHRNHLGVMSISVPSNATGTFADDFTVLANNYIAPGAASNPVILLADGIHYGLWAGDVNTNGVINGTDVSSIKLAIANSATGYLATDVNLSNTVNGTDVSLTKNIIAASGSGSTPARSGTPIDRVSIPPIKYIVRTNIPD